MPQRGFCRDGNSGIDEGGETAVLVGVERVFTAVDGGHEAAQADAADGELVGEVELLGVGEEVGVLFFEDGGAVEAVFDGVGVAGRCAVGDIQCAAAMRFAQLRAFDGVVFAGGADGRGGGAGGHDVGIIYGRGRRKN